MVIRFESCNAGGRARSANDLKGRKRPCSSALTDGSRTGTSSNAGLEVAENLGACEDRLRVWVFILGWQMIRTRIHVKVLNKMQIKVWERE